jgi:hypothetical protein
MTHPVPHKYHYSISDCSDQEEKSYGRQIKYDIFFCFDEIFTNNDKAFLVQDFYV